jgi:Ciliary basal body-associated, B9 protein
MFEKTRFSAMKELTKLQNYAQHTSLDPIENLKITINLYKKGETDALLDTLEVKWQQVVTKAEISTLKPLKLSSPVSPKKKSRRESKLKSLKRCIYTNIDLSSVDGITKKMTEINIAKDFMRDIKTSKGLERNLQEYNPDKAKLFPEIDVDVLGIPKDGALNRWTETAGQLAYSEMQFFALLTKPTPSVDDTILKSSSNLNLNMAPEEEIDHLLCSISYFGNGNFVISPDFTTKSTRHHFKIGDDTYEYTIENSSDKLSPENERKEQLIFEEFFKRQNRAKLEKLPKEFQFIPDGYTERIHFLGEIVSCHSFNSDLLYCQYLFNVPSEWKNDIGVVNLLSASTQVSYARVQGDERISFFGCPVDLQLICGTETPKSPTLYIKVMSVDGEDRHAVEGYGTVILPKQVGIHHFELKTWKPISPRTNELKTFFLGGSPELGELNFNELEVLVL